MSTTTKNTDTNRVIALAQEVTDTLTDLPYKPSLTVFEDYGPINRTSGKIAQRAEMCGIIKAFILVALRIPLITVAPPALKNFATGKGNASKEMMLNEANKYGYYPDTHDEADAFFLARIGQRVIQGSKVGVAYTRSNPIR